MPIRRKLTLVMVVVTLTALTFACAAFILTSRASARNQFLQNANSMGMVLRDNLSATLWFDDPQSAQEMLESLAVSNSIVSAQLFTANKTPFATFRGRSIHQSANEVPETYGPHEADGLLTLHLPIYSPDGAIGGSLVIAQSLDSLNQTLSQSILIAVAILLFSILASLALSEVLNSMITAPLLKLTETTREIASTEAWHTRVPKTAEDETGSLVDSFNLLMETIEQDRDSLKQWTAKLEQRVADKTEDYRKAAEEARAADNAKSDFLAIMSHELRTPLNPIVGFTSLMLNTQKDEATREHLGIIMQSAERMMELIDKLLRFSRLDKGTVEPIPEPVLLDALLREELRNAEPAAHGLDLRYENSLEGIPDSNIDPQLVVATDGNILRRILDNLIDNACKYTREGSVSLRAGILEKLPGHIHVAIEVSDTGPGIPRSFRNQLFAPFTQVDSSYAREYEGVGLGLAICQRLVTALKGTIEVESERNKGSTFRVTVGFDLAPLTHPLNRPRERHSITKLAGGDCHILVAEDQVSNQMVVKTLLETIGARVTLAANGREAIEQCNQTPFDLVLMDLSMPEVDGIEATRCIRESSPINALVPIVFFTANASEQTRGKCMAAGANDYLIKPVRAEELEAVVLKALPSKDPSLV